MYSTYCTFCTVVTYSTSKTVDTFVCFIIRNSCKSATYCRIRFKSLGRRNMSFQYDPILKMLTTDNGTAVSDASFLVHKEKADIMSVAVEFIIAGSSHTQSITANIKNMSSLEELTSKIDVAYHKIYALRIEAAELSSRVVTAGESEVQTQRGIDWHALVLEEEKYRNSAEMAAAYASTETDGCAMDWIEYTGAVVQPDLLRRHGIEPTVWNLNRLRVAAQDTEVFWVKHNRARQGYLRPGSRIPPGNLLYDVSNDKAVIYNLCTPYFPEFSVLIPIRSSTCCLIPFKILDGRLFFWRGLYHDPRSGKSPRSCRAFTAQCAPLPTSHWST